MSRVRSALILGCAAFFFAGPAAGRVAAQPDLRPPSSNFDDNRTEFDDVASPFDETSVTEDSVVDGTTIRESLTDVAPVVAGPPPKTTEFALNTLFVFVCAVLVLLMQAGFAMVEAGFNGSKHTVNILFKSVSGMTVGVLIYFVVGYHLMYPTTPLHENVLGQIAPGFESASSRMSAGSELVVHVAGGVNFVYQAALAMVVAAIVSGAVAGRMKFGAYLVTAAAVTGFVYPVIGYWKWGQGWLDDLGFFDFAGGGVVHMTGGFIGLAGAVMLGPRIGRYTPDGKPIAIPGHSLPLATLGVFLMLVGWQGFNAGHQLGITGAADRVADIAANTILAACASGALSTSLSWFLFGKPDLSMALNGLLGGLVGVSAGCTGVSSVEAVVIGAVSGVFVVAAIILLDKLRIDDPVGAFPVHGICGMWGLIACSIFGDASLWGHVGGDISNASYANLTAQIIGIIAIAGFAFGSMAMLFGLLRGVDFLRVSPEDEQRGLDFSEHGMSAYAA